jgi:hypothetical protein
MMIIHAGADEVEETRSASFLSNFKFDDNQIFAAHCVNVADQMQFQRERPAFAKHPDTNVERHVAAIRQARPTETTAKKNDQEDGSRKSQPGDPSKEFQSDRVERSAGVFSAQFGSDHQQLIKSEDRS